MQGETERREREGGEENNSIHCDGERADEEREREKEKQKSVGYSLGLEEAGSLQVKNQFLSINPLHSSEVIVNACDCLYGE